MPLNLASPGIVIREVDLTIGRVDPTSGSIGALVAPFAKGPVNDPQLIESEEDLLQTFGQPYSTDKHFEHWMVASSYLAYGGTMQVVRAGDTGLKNAFAGTASDVVINGAEHYKQLQYDDNTITNVTVAAKNPGTWANGIKVAMIDAQADQLLTGIPVVDAQGNSTVGSSIVVPVPAGTVDQVGAGVTALLDGNFIGVISGVQDGKAAVKFVNHIAADGTVTHREYQQNGNIRFPDSSTANVAIHTAGQSVAWSTVEGYTAQTDWFKSQNITLSNGSLEWDQLADAPGTSTFVNARGGRYDEVHVVVIDDSGDITGNAGTILEKHLNLSKATDAEYSVGSTSYWLSLIHI